MREAVGPDVAIRLDANQGWTPRRGREVIRALEVADLGVEFVEQPVVADDVEGLAWVRERVGLPVMADESLLRPLRPRADHPAGAADLVNVKLAKCGSLAVARDMLRRADEAGLRTIVGSMMETPVGVGARAAVAAAHPTTRGGRPRRGVVVGRVAGRRGSRVRRWPAGPVPRRPAQGSRRLL